jgi:hypothetical protein
MKAIYYMSFPLAVSSQQASKMIPNPALWTLSMVHFQMKPPLRSASIGGDNPPTLAMFVAPLSRYIISQ